jgi:SPW repeat
MSTVHSSIDHHPDLLALRERYDRAAESMTAQGTFGLTLLTAVYVAVSPGIVGFTGTRPLVDNDFIVGLVCVALAFAYAMALDRSHGMTWTLPVFGVWLIVWSNVIAGAVLTLLGLNAMYFGMRARSSASA